MSRRIFFSAKDDKVEKIFMKKNWKVFWKIENLMNNSKIFKMRVTTLEINQKKTEKGSYYIIWNKIEGSSQQRWYVTTIKR